MGNHGLAGARLRARRTNQHAKESAPLQFRGRRVLALRDWPVSWRLIAVIVMALVMGLVFGGLRLAAAVSSGAQFGRISQLAKLGQQVTGLVQALEDERDQTTGIIPAASPKTAAASLQSWYNATDAAAAKVQGLAVGINGSFPANIQSRVGAVLSVISHLGPLRVTAQASQSALAVIADYAGPISDMIALNSQIAEGAADSGLVSSVQALTALAQAKDVAAQQRAILFNALTQQLFADGELQALTTAQSEQATDLAAFDVTATPSEQASFRNIVAGQHVNQAELIEEYVISVGSLDTTALNIGPAAAPARWYSAMSDTVQKMQAVELGLASTIVTRAQLLQHDAEDSALLIGFLTALILFLVLGATLAVARSLVRPLNRLREGALNIATVQLPERVRKLGEALDPLSDQEVAPINVLSADEIGQVARAFDQVHSEAVRLAGNEAMLRSSFNAMFVNLSRRSQVLIERLARTIDSLEQHEDDPGRLSDLFSMDHLVTRMRRNSENLLLLAGHEGARKWSEPVPLADVARAATSEIEQYSRVTQKIQPGIAVAGQAVSDVVHLLAEIIENATIFSPTDTPVLVSAEELSSGGVLIEISDHGVGIPEARLVEMNWRLDNPPVMDVSVSRHMGLFAVARLAERHGVRVRLLAGSPEGLTALVWLPDSVVEREARQVSWPRRQPGWATLASERGVDPQRQAVPAAAQAAAFPASASPAVAAPPARTAPARTAPARTAPARTASAAPTPGSRWFRSQEPAIAGTADYGGRAEEAMAAGGNGPSAADPWADGRHAAQIVADPVLGERTAAGLPARIPRANLIPGSLGTRRAGMHEAPPPTASNRPGPPATAPGPPESHPSPDITRSRLGGFQSGIRRAKSQTPGAGEGAGN
ncbi:MAG TPA: nitrate- and nitrite sensing domain-containing protein [Streptosporangiaceae bacterium]